VAPFIFFFKAAGGKNCPTALIVFFPSAAIYTMKQLRCKADIRNPLLLLAHERSRFATCVQIKK